MSFVLLIGSSILHELNMHVQSAHGDTSYPRNASVCMQRLAINLTTDY
jgi:hypothetical protein